MQVSCMFQQMPVDKKTSDVSWNTKKTFSVREIIELALAMKSGAWKGRLDEDEVDVLERAVTGKGTKDDYEELAGFFDMADVIESCETGR